MRFHRRWEVLALLWVVLYNLLFIVPMTFLIEHALLTTELRIFILFISTTISLVALYYLLYTRLTYTR